MRSTSTLCALLGIAPLFSPLATAQTVPASTSASVAIPELVPQAALTARIKLRNVTPEIMAWWLDPQHQKEPLIFRIARENAARGNSPLRAPERGSGMLEQVGEPRVSLRALEASNELEITGTPEQIERARQIVPVFDQPLRQVELEFSIVRLRDAEDSAPLLPKGAVKAEAEGPFQIGLRSNWATRLREMEKDGRASVTSRARLTAINNLTAALMTTETSTARMKWNGSEREVPVESSVGFIATPTINNDDTVTLALEGGYFLSMQAGSRRVPLSSTPMIVANVRDGDTIVLGNISVPANAIEKSRVFAGQKIEGPHRDLLIVTARIVRRYSESARDERLLNE